MQIIFFPRDDPNDMDRFFIKTFEEFHFVPLVDAVHGNDQNWMIQKFNCPHLFFCLDNNTDLYGCIAKDLTERPSFVVYFNEDREISSYEWECIELYFKNMIHGRESSSRLNRVICNLKNDVTTVTPMNDPPEQETQAFSFREHGTPDHNFFEITNHRGKVYTLKSTSMVDKEDKYRLMIVQFLKYPAFGKDILGQCFLKKLWDHFEKDEFNLDKILETGCRTSEPDITEKRIEQLLNQ